MVTADQGGFIDFDDRSAALSKAGDPLERLGLVLDFEVFRSDLDAATNRSDGAKGGRPAFDPVMMFKVLVLQALHGLSDAQAEFQILDRRSFGRFLGIDDGDRVPPLGRLAMQIACRAMARPSWLRPTDEEREIVKGGGIPNDWKGTPAKLAQKDRISRQHVSQCLPGIGGALEAEARS